MRLCNTVTDYYCASLPCVRRWKHNSSPQPNPNSGRASLSNSCRTSPHTPALRWRSQSLRRRSISYALSLWPVCRKAVLHPASPRALHSQNAQVARPNAASKSRPRSIQRSQLEATPYRRPTVAMRRMKLRECASALNASRRRALTEVRQTHLLVLSPHSVACTYIARTDIHPPPAFRGGAQTRRRRGAQAQANSGGSRSSRWQSAARAQRAGGCKRRSGGRPLSRSARSSQQQFDGRSRHGSGRAAAQSTPSSARTAATARTATELAAATTTAACATAAVSASAGWTAGALSAGIGHGTADSAAPKQNPTPAIWATQLTCNEQQQCSGERSRYVHTHSVQSIQRTTNADE
jgi:hypothetical protein